MDGKVVFRLSKTGQTIFKSKTYEIRVNGNIIGQIENKNYTLSEDLPKGKYLIEVGENEFFVRKEIILTNGQMQTITINPSLTFPFSLAILIGIAICTASLIGFMAFTNNMFPQLLPLLFASFIPILVFRKKDYGHSFASTISITQ